MGGVVAALSVTSDLTRGHPPGEAMRACLLTTELARRAGGVHRGLDAIMAYLGQSAELTAGSLRAVPQALMGDGTGHVAVLTQLSATRPDGRSIDNPQVVLFTLDGDRVRSVDQFVGDPRAVAAFWA
jgi:ketosteroid isomerase-like protein